MRETIGPRKAERNSDSCFWLYEFVLGKASCFQQEDVLSLWKFTFLPATIRYWKSMSSESLNGFMNHV